MDCLSRLFCCMPASHDSAESKRLVEQSSGQPIANVPAGTSTQATVNDAVLAAALKANIGGKVDAVVDKGVASSQTSVNKGVAASLKSTGLPGPVQSVATKSITPIVTSVTEKSGQSVKSIGHKSVNSSVDKTQSSWGGKKDKDKQ